MTNKKGMDMAGMVQTMELDGRSDRRHMGTFVNCNGGSYYFDSRTYSISKVSNLYADVLQSWDKNIDELIRKMAEKYPDKMVREIYTKIENHTRCGIFSLEDDLYIEAPTLEKIILLLSENCNLACRYCFEAGKTNGTRHNSVMSKRVVKKSLLYLFQHSKMNEVCVQFYGGEPLLNFEVMKYAVLLGKRLAMKFNKRVRFLVITNGTLIDDEVAKYFSKNRDSISLQISVDATRSSHDSNRVFRDGKGSYNNVVRGLEVLKKYKVAFSIMVVMSGAVLSEPHWLKQIRDLTDDAVGMCSIATSNRQLMPKADDWKTFLSEYEDYLRRETLDFTKVSDRQLAVYKIVNQIKNGKRYYFGCGCGLSELTIGADGVVYLCERMEMKTLRTIDDIADVHDMWMPYAANVLHKACSTCWAKYLCGGGCTHTKRSIYRNDLPHKWDCAKRKLEIKTALKYLVHEYETNISN